MKLTDFSFATVMHLFNLFAVTRVATRVSSAKLSTMILASVFTVFAVANAYAGDVRINGKDAGEVIEIEEPDGDSLFSVRTVDGTRGFSVNGMVHLDYTQFDGSLNQTEFNSITEEDRSNSNTDIRRARLQLNGFSGNWHFKLGYDLVNNDDLESAAINSVNNNRLGNTLTTSSIAIDGDSGLTDFYAQYRFEDWAWLTIGRQKIPFSMDYLTSSNDIVALERNILAEAFAPRRHIALGLRGSGDNFGYQFAVFEEDDDTDRNDLSLALRLTADSAFDRGNAHFHIGFSFLDRNINAGTTTATTTFISTPEPLIRNTEVYGSNRIFSGPLAYEGLLAYGLEFAFSAGPVYLKTEFIEASYNNADKDSGSSTDLDGYSIELAWAITGEQRSYDRITGTYSRLTPSRPHVGAWELYARLSELDLDTSNRTDPTDIRFVPASAVYNSYRGVTLGFNWYASNNIRVGMSIIDVSIDHNRYSDDVLSNPDNIDGDAVQLRLQYAF